MQVKEFNHIVKQIKDKMFRIAFRVVRNKVEAADVVQDALVKAWNSRDKLRDVDNKEAYIMMIVRNKAIDLVRSRKVHTSDIDEHFDISSNAANPERAAIARDEYKRVMDYIETMPENHRTVLQLRDIEGYSYKEISAITGYSLEKVKVYLFRARIKIKEHFKTRVS